MYFSLILPYSHILKVIAGIRHVPFMLGQRTSALLFLMDPFLSSAGRCILSGYMGPLHEEKGRLGGNCCHYAKEGSPSSPFLLLIPTKVRTLVGWAPPIVYRRPLRVLTESQPMALSWERLCPKLTKGSTNV